jgi:hypothetical protein
VVRAINCNTETWNRKYIAQFFALSFLNHYSIKDRFVDTIRCYVIKRKRKKKKQKQELLFIREDFDSLNFRDFISLMVRAINSNTETWNIKYIAQFFALSFLNHYSIKDRFVDSPINVANTILNLLLTGESNNTVLCY